MFPQMFCVGKDAIEKRPSGRAVGGTVVRQENDAVCLRQNINAER